MIKSEITGSCPIAPNPFPKLMEGKGTGVIVLFTAYRVGVVVAQSTSACRVGVHIANWDMNTFKDFKGEVTLSNIK